MSIRFRRAQRAEIHIKDFGRLRSELEGLDDEFDLVHTNDILHSKLLNILVVCQNLGQGFYVSWLLKNEKQPQ